jgi:hypothetical protein
MVTAILRAALNLRVSPPPTRIRRRRKKLGIAGVTAHPVRARFDSKATNSVERLAGRIAPPGSLRVESEDDGRCS